MSKKALAFFLTFSLIFCCMPFLVTSAANGTAAKSLGNSNPLMDYKYGADPCALVYNGRVYVYMSGDKLEYNSNGTIKDNDYSEITQVFVESSSDMVNWTDNGSIPVAGANNANSGKGIAKWAGHSWAPAVAHKVINGKDKFFLYFANGAAGIGVLTADSPLGPWKDPIGKPLITTSTSGFSGVTWLFDPAVLVDSDGTGYLYCGGGIPNSSSQSSIANPKTARVVKLDSSMTGVSGSGVTIDAPYMFEDSGIHKYNGKYYYSYCMNFSGSHPSSYPAGEIGYMVSSSPMGPFSYAGHFLKNPGSFFGVGGNNHHAVFEFNNQWYVVYHAQTVSKAVLGSGKGYRSPHINKLYYNSDGTIKEVKADMTGVSQTADINPYERTEAETIGWNSGIKTEDCSASGGPTNNQDVTSINNGDWIALGNVAFGTSGAKSFKANIASTSSGKIEIRLDNPNGTLVGSLNVSSTGGTQNWQTVETNISGATGTHRLFFVFTGSGTGNLFNFDYWQFSQDGSGGQSSNDKIECEDMTLSGDHAGKISSPFSGVALYANGDSCSSTQYFSYDKHDFTLRGCSSNSGTAKVDLNIGGTKVGSFSFTGTTPTTQTISNVENGTGNQDVTLTVTTDDGTWDAYVDYLQWSLPSGGTTPSSGSIKVQEYNGNTATSLNTLNPNFRIVNTGSTSINLSDVKARYYFTSDSSQQLNFACDWCSAGISDVTGTFGTASGSNADHYCEIGFSSGAGTLAPGESATVQTRIWKSDWSNFDQSNDYSFNSSASSFTDWSKVTGYVSGVLQWGANP